MLIPFLSEKLVAQITDFTWKLSHVLTEVFIS